MPNAWCPKVAAEFALKPSQATKAGKSRDVERLEEELSDLLATRVTIKANAKGKGQVVIDFSGYDQLDGVIAKLRPE